jgi:hypothetical protein
VRPADLLRFLRSLAVLDRQLIRGQRVLLAASDAELSARREGLSAGLELAEVGVRHLINSFILA